MSLTKVSFSMVNGDVVNVLDFGATGNGVTDDTAAIQAAADAADGKVLFFPKGTYLISEQGTAYGAVNYCIYPDIANLYWEGEGDESIIKLNLHRSPGGDSDYTVICLAQKVTGDVEIRNLKIESAQRVDTNHNGPWAVSLGANDSTNFGQQENVIIENVVMKYISIALHGKGGKKIFFRDNDITIQAGGLFPGGFNPDAQVVNVFAAHDGSPSPVGQITDLMEISGNTVTCDGVYDNQSKKNFGFGTTSPAGVFADRAMAVASPTGGEFIAENTTENIVDNDLIGGFAFKLNDTSGNDPHYSGIKARANGNIGAMDLEFYSALENYENDDPDAVLLSGGAWVIRDGITAPATIPNYAAIYVDTADGDLKIKFGNGTVKTIVTDS